MSDRQPPRDRSHLKRYKDEENNNNKNNDSNNEQVKPSRAEQSKAMLKRKIELIARQTKQVVVAAQTD